MTTITFSIPKVAWIRNSDVPPGERAPGHLHCPCGHSPESWYSESQGNVLCACGQEYTYDGWKIAKPDIHEWPYPDIKAAWHSHNPCWRETDQAAYDDQLGCVPPIRMEGGFFMVGECETCDDGGNVYAVFGEVQGRFFCRFDYIQNFNPADYQEEIEIYYFPKEIK